MRLDHRTIPQYAGPGNPRRDSRSERTAAAGENKTRTGATLRRITGTRRKRRPGDREDGVQRQGEGDGVEVEISSDKTMPRERVYEFEYFFGHSSRCVEIR